MAKNKVVGAMQNTPNGFLLVTENGDYKCGKTWRFKIKSFTTTSTHAMVTLVNGYRCTYEFANGREVALSPAKF